MAAIEERYAKCKGEGCTNRKWPGVIFFSQDLCHKCGVKKQREEFRGMLEKIRPRHEKQLPEKFRYKDAVQRVITGIKGDFVKKAYVNKRQYATLTDDEAVHVNALEYALQVSCDELKENRVFVVFAPFIGRRWPFHVDEAKYIISPGIIAVPGHETHAILYCANLAGKAILTYDSCPLAHNREAIETGMAEFGREILRQIGVQKSRLHIRVWQTGMAAQLASGGMPRSCGVSVFGFGRLLAQDIIPGRFTFPTATLPFYKRLMAVLVEKGGVNNMPKPTIIAMFRHKSDACKLIGRDASALDKELADLKKRECEAEADEEGKRISWIAQLTGQFF